MQQKYVIMPRKSRQYSDTGVYHVMLRGIDRGDIFTDEQDFLKFIKILKGLAAPIDKDGHPLPAICTFYAYCLMTNHVHLLINDNGNGISEVMKSIGISYVSYFNKRHYRLGPLFHDRFRSEPVGNELYFFTLLRYIHDNPVEAGITETPGEYRWSSWHEYESVKPLTGAICSTRFPFATLEWEEMRLSVINLEKSAKGKIKLERRRKTDQEAVALLSNICGEHGIGTIKFLQKGEKEHIIAEALSREIGMRQLARVTGIDYKSIQRIKQKFEIDNF